MKYPPKEITAILCTCNTQPFSCPWNGVEYVNPRITVDSDKVEEELVIE